MCTAIEESDSASTLRTATPVDEDVIETKTVSMEIGVDIPFLEGHGIDSTKAVSIEDVRLRDDGSLHVECLARASSDETERDTASRTNDVPRPPQDPESANEGDTETTAENGGDSSPSDSDDITEAAAPEDRLETDDESVRGNDETASADDVDEVDDVEDVGDIGDVVDVDDFEDTSELPAYRDPDRLQEVYDEYSTFSEMTEALGVDVTPQTVRRYMIKHNIHEPSPNTGSSSISALLEADPDSIPLLSNENEDDGRDDGDRERVEEQLPSSSSVVEKRDAEEPPEENENETSSSEVDARNGDAPSVSASTNGTVAKGDERRSNGELDVRTVPEGVELPDHLGLDEIKEIVRDSQTLYEAKERMDLERDQARKLLGKLNLLDLVQSRLSTREFQERTLDEINQRIHSVSREEA